MRDPRKDNLYFYCAFDIYEKELKDFGVIGEIKRQVLLRQHLL